VDCIVQRMKLAEWARQQGLGYQTAYRWFRTGILPVPSKQLPTGTILVEPVPLGEKRGAAVYA
jgi:putative resolvase